MIQQKTGHLEEYDFLRVAASFFVVGVHVLEVIDYQNLFSLTYFRIMQMIFFTCNGCFFMMSGFFAVKECRDYRRYYLKKLVGLIIPLFFYFLIRTVYLYFDPAQFDPAQRPWFFKFFVKNVLFDFITTEYWFLYALIGFLMIAPLMAKAFVRFSQTESLIFVLISLGYNALTWVFEIVFHKPFAYNQIFGGWAFYFFFGACIDKILNGNRKRENLLLCVGAVCGIATVLLNFKGITGYIHDFSPLYGMVTAAMYVLLLRIGRSWKEHTTAKQRSIVLFISKHTLSIYLLHMIVFRICQKRLPATYGLASILMHIGLTIFVYVLTLILGALIDHVIQILQDYCSRILKV